MRRLIIMVVMLALGLAGAYAQSSVVTLQNQEDATFYYVVDPPELQGLSAGSPLLATKVAAFFASAKPGPSFASLGPNAEAGLNSLSDGTHLLVGVFAQEGETDLPVRVISLEADSRAGERFYALFATPAQLSVTRGVGRLASLAPSAATNTVASAQTAAPAPDATSAAAASPTSQTQAASAATTSGAVGQTATAAPTASAGSSATTTTTTAASTPAAVAATPAVIQKPKLGQIASFYSYDPVIFTREGRGDFTVLPIADSRGWKLTGTKIAGLSGVIDSAGFHLALSVPGGFSESVSYFFYVFATRAAGQSNTLTLELEPRAEGSRGACLLWQKGSSDPRIIGSVQSTPTSIELDIMPDDLNAALGGMAGDTVSIDLTSGWYDHALGTWEEFYYTTLSASQIPVTR